MKDIFKETIRNASTGMQAIDNVLPYVSDESLRQVMQEQRDLMKTYYDKAREGLSEEEIEEAEGNKFSKTMMKAGASLSAMMNRDSSHIAEMLIEGYQMGVTSMQKCLNECQAHKGDIPEFARELIKSYDKCIKSLRKFL